MAITPALPSGSWRVPQTFSEAQHEVDSPGVYKVRVVVIETAPGLITRGEGERNPGNTAGRTRKELQWVKK